MAEILDHGQQLDLRTRRGADFALALSIDTNDTETTPLTLTGATVVSRIFAPGQPDMVFSGAVDGPGGVITVSLTAAQTLTMTQDWQYVLGFKLSGSTTPLLFGALRVSQDQL